MYLALSQCCSLTFIQLEITSAKRKLVGWCNDNHLLLNVSKTKEIVVDFRRYPPPPPLLVISAEEVEIVGEYKYLGSIIDCKLDWSLNALALLKKGNQRLYFMKKLKSFRGSVCPKLLEHKSTVESVVTFNSLCHFGGLKEQDKARLSKITKTASRLIGRPVPDLQALFEAKAVWSAWRPSTVTPLTRCAQSCRPTLRQDLEDWSAFGPRQTSSIRLFFQLLSAFAMLKWSCDLGQTYCWQDSCSLLLYHLSEVITFVCFYTYCLNWSNLIYLCRYYCVCVFGWAAGGRAGEGRQLILLTG